MKAYRHDRYGAPHVLRLDDVPDPELPDEAVLVRIRASSVNAADWHYLRGRPYLVRFDEGLRHPKDGRRGIDVAGHVEAVGAKVTDLQVGDRVFGSRSGAFAELVAGRNMVPIPAGLTFEQAAAIPTAGQTALQALRNKGGLQAGQRVLVNGAGGGVGTFTVQIARALGAEVTAVSHEGNVDLLHSLGADRVIDYTREDFTRGTGRFDLIVDCGGNRSVRRLRRALSPTGRAVLVAPGPGEWVGPIRRVVGAVVSSRVSDRKVIPFLSTVDREDLRFLGDLADAGELTPVIDRVFGFEDAPAAIEYVESGSAQGKVVIRH